MRANDNRYGTATTSGNHDSYLTRDPLLTTPLHDWSHDAHEFLNSEFPHSRLPATWMTRNPPSRMSHRMEMHAMAVHVSCPTMGLHGRAAPDMWSKPFHLPAVIAFLSRLWTASRHVWSARGAQCASILPRNSLALSDCVWSKNSDGVPCSTIWPSDMKTTRSAA